MDMTYSWRTWTAWISANRRTDDFAAARVNDIVGPLLAQQTGIATGLDETQRTVQTLVPKSAYRSVRGTISSITIRDAKTGITSSMVELPPERT